MSGSTQKQTYHWPIHRLGIELMQFDGLVPTKIYNEDKSRSS